MEDKSAAAGHPSGLTFGVEIAGSERMIYVPGAHDRRAPVTVLAGLLVHDVSS